MILVCGLPDEEPIAMLVYTLEKKGAEFRVLDQEVLVDQVKLRWQLTDQGLTGQIKIWAEVIDVAEIKSVYHRWLNVEDAIGVDTPPLALEKTRSILRSLSDLFDILPARVVNRRRPMMANNSKPYQALLIRQVGFSTPETFITNKPGSLLRFASVSGPLVYKSISSTRSIVAQFDRQSLEKIDTLSFLPTQFQHQIEGFNLRVHVIGRRLFATQILTEATDYRYAGQTGVPAEFRPFKLNVELRQKCINLARYCQLDFAGIDLIVSCDKVYCLEVNPSPGYSYYQNATGQPISDALADYLMR